MTTCYIAEIGNNHNGDIDLAKKMIDAALESGADYVKFQVYNINKFIDGKNPYYNEFIAEALSFDAFEGLKKYTEEKDGKFLATPFDEDSLALLHKIGLDTVKISSGDMNNWQLLTQALRLQKRLIVSLGGATIEEIDKTVAFLKENKARFSILHCVLNYPARFEELNLNFIRTLKKRYSCDVGYSDHSLGIEASLAAVTLGACIIEKHFTIDGSLPCGDNDMSVLPHEFKRLKEGNTNVEISLGSEQRMISEDEKKIKCLVRRKFAAKRDIPRGTVICDEDLLPLRFNDADGFDAGDYYLLIGKRVNNNIKKGELITKVFINEKP